VNTMWVAAAGQNDEGFSTDVPDIARELAGHYCNTSFADIYESDLVIFMDGPKSKQDSDALRDDLLSGLPAGVTLTRYTNLMETTDVREAFLKNRDCASDAKRIFPGRLCFDGEEISFTKDCRARIQQGETAVSEALTPLKPLTGERDADELKHTLAVYLLDTESGLTETADRLFLHKNTVKYRLRCMSDRFGYRVGAMPASISLYLAVAIDRLLKS
jgi:hypothetical protein